MPVWRSPARCVSLHIASKRRADLIAVDQPTIKATTRILLLEGGTLDRVRSWTGLDHWENRVSSLTAENVAWLDSELRCSAPACPPAQSARDSAGIWAVLISEIGVWKHIAEDRSCPVNEMVVSFPKRH